MAKDKVQRALLCGGGTGGHLIPGIALYEALKSQGFSLRYVLRKQDVRYVSANRLDAEESWYVDITGISRRLSWRTPFMLWKLLRTCVHMFFWMRRFHPDFVLGTGGYVCIPVYLCAILQRVPIFMAEQNSVAGVTSRFFACWAQRIFTSFPQTLFLSPKKCRYTGNPRLNMEQMQSKSQIYQAFGLRPDKPVLLISGGSQGARLINQMVYESLQDLRALGFSVLWSMGVVEFRHWELAGWTEDVLDHYADVHVVAFIERMADALSIADVSIARAGAGTVSDSIAFGVPTIFVPIYRSPDNHQYRNAAFLADKGLASIIEEPQLNKDALLNAIQTTYAQKSNIQKGLQALHPKNTTESIVQCIVRKDPTQEVTI